MKGKYGYVCTINGYLFKVKIGERVNNSDFDLKDGEYYYCAVYTIHRKYGSYASIYNKNEIYDNPLDALNYGIPTIIQEKVRLHNQKLYDSILTSFENTINCLTFLQNTNQFLKDTKDAGNTHNSTSKANRKNTKRTRS